MRGLTWAGGDCGGENLPLLGATADLPMAGAAVAAVPTAFLGRLVGRSARFQSLQCSCSGPPRFQNALPPLAAQSGIASLILSN